MTVFPLCLARTGVRFFLATIFLDPTSVRMLRSLIHLSSGAFSILPGDFSPALSAHCRELLLDANCALTRKILFDPHFGFFSFQFSLESDNLGSNRLAAAFEMASAQL